MTALRRLWLWLTGSTAVLEDVTAGVLLAVLAWVFLVLLFSC
jgi:hypothetical protein